MTFNILTPMTQLPLGLERHPGGHNWPDMEIVVDPGQTEITDGEIYLVQIQEREPTVKKCSDEGAAIKLMPALQTVHGSSKVKFGDHEIPCTSIEFTDSIYKRFLTIHGRVVGIWAGSDQLDQEQATNAG